MRVIDEAEVEILDEHIVTMEGELWVARSMTRIAALPEFCPSCGAALVSHEEEPTLYDTLIGAIASQRVAGTEVPILVAQA